MNRNNTKKDARKGITQIFFLSILGVMVAIAVITHVIMILWRPSHIFGIEGSVFNILLFELLCFIAGAAVVVKISKRILKPLYITIEAMEQITRGDYSIRLDFTGTREFVQLGEKFNCMAQELGSVEMLRNDFINQFSHEFNTPIISIRGFAGMLKRGDLTDAEREDYLDRIISGSDRLSNLALNVLNLSKIEQQAILTHKEVYNVTEQLRRSIAMLSLRWESKKIQFDFDCREYYVTGNEEFLSYLWSNLLDNAIKYSPMESVIRIGMEEDEESLIIKIRDHGRGISEEALPHVFDKFYRSRSSQSIPGTGLGLAIAKKVVLLHQGTIQVSSKVGEGAEFTVALPRCDDMRK